ncbi:DUF1189 domain-containing protein [Mesobacillus foraminis]|uniref:DUF1189 domain-containing protein n=1 Tax=Mesobacillus foraminis TaxID=279826 RepID=UPI00214ACD5F|nr:DUF1189 domain-containing protein [Mesobacillus foraminis]
MMNIFKQLYRSLFSPKDIASFRFQGIGKTILYVFILTLLSILPAVYYSATAMMSAVEATKQTINEDFPSFTIENGQLQSDATQEKVIDKGSITIVFDSTGKLDAQKISNSDDTLAILRDEIVLSAAGETNSIPYTMFAQETITKDDISTLLNHSDRALAFILPLLFLIIFVFTSALAFIEISILAWIGLLLKNAAGKKLAYRHLWRMTAYSITLPTIFFMIMSILQTNVPMGFLINWFISLTILLLAIKEVPGSKDQPNLS